MAGEKRFGKALFGFKKSDVHDYIILLMKEFDDKLKAKDEEIATLKGQFREMRIKYEELARRSDEINEDRAKIASVLIKAQEKAEIMLDDARKEALEEKKNLEHSIEQEREKLVDVKEELKSLKSEVIQRLKRFEEQIEEVVEEEQESFEDEEQESF